MFLPSEILEKLIINVIRVLQLHVHTISLIMMATIRFQEMKLMHIKAYGYYTMASLIILEIYFLQKAILILNKRYA